MIKIVIVAITIVVIIALISYVVLTLAKRVKPLPPNRELEEARRIMLELQTTDELIPSLPERSRKRVNEFLARSQDD